MFDGFSREVVHAKHHTISYTKMIPGQGPDEFFFIIDSCRDPSKRVHHRKVPQIGSMNIFYCNPCRHITKLLEKLISKG